MAEEKNEVTKVTKQDVALAIGNSGIADSILASFNKLASQGQLVFPKGYSVGNQLKLMYTNLMQSGATQGVTSISVGEALTEAVIQGLEIDKKQCYFIKYGNKIQMFRSYYGDIAAAKRTGLVKDIRARVIYEGDEYEDDTDENGESIITSHKTKLINRDNKIIGAYAWADMKDGTKKYCIMTMKEIQANWNKSKDPSRNVQKDFPQEMAKRSVIRRLVKMIFNTASTDISDESKSIIASFNRTTEEEYDNTPKETGQSSVNNDIDMEEDNVVDAEVSDVHQADEDSKF